jgi:hypothetical protein
MAITVGITVPVAAATVYVAQDAPGPTHDGQAWQTAFTSVEAGLAAAQSGDDVWVAGGIYNVSLPATGGDTLLPLGVRLYGGFAGDETALEQRGRAHVSELRTALGSGPALTVAEGAGPSTVLDGFTIVAQISVDGASPTISHNTFAPGDSTFAQLPRAATQGVLRCANGSSPTVINNIFTGASDVAIDCGDGSPVIVGNTIVGNQWGISRYGYGHPVVANNIIAFNSAGLYSLNIPLTTVRGNCFYGNLIEDFLNTASVVGKDGNISADPKLASYMLGNLHIQPDSPCRDAGDDSAVLGDKDADLQPRVQGEHVDIGADESDGRTWTATPTIIRVAPDGDDGNDGATWQSPKRTIQAAVDAAAVTGGEVWARKGEYADATATPRNGSVVLPASVGIYGGFAGTETTRNERNWTEQTTTLANPQGYPVVVATAGRWNSAVDGFNIRVSPVASAHIRSGVECVNGSPILANDTFVASTKFGPLIHGTYSSFLLFNSTIRGCDVGGDLVTTEFGSPAIWNNVFAGNSVPGAGGMINMKSGLGMSIRNNLFDGNTAARGGGLVRNLGGIVQMSNNTFVHNTGAVTGFDNVLGGIYANNVFAFNTPAVTPIPDTASVRNNDFFAEGRDAFVDSRGNLVANPLFQDAAAADYRLTAASPCIDTGDDTVVGLGESDLEGHPRIQGAHVDMGAYEFAGRPATPNLTDVIAALRIAGGLEEATPDAMTRLGVRGSVGLTDAVTVMRAAVGSD